MIDFQIYPLRRDTVLYLASQREQIWLDPPYQRLGDIWTREKKQLLIDSIINGFDIPKLYFREYTTLFQGDSDKPRYRYAIIDGKQRLTSTWQFIDGQFALSNDFEYFRDPKVKAAGLTYKELATEYPKLRLEFDQTSLPIIAIVTEDDEIIEDLFSRLNEAVALTAAEKRNAFGGPLPGVIRQLAGHRFFVERLPFANSRYRHFDIATKFLFFEYQGGVADTKKAYLDDFVLDFKQKSDEDARELESRANHVLDKMAADFVRGDTLLQRVGMVSIYYLLYKDSIGNDPEERLTRWRLEAFERRREENRRAAEDEIAEAEYTLLEFDRYAQSPNDAVALKYRLDILKSFVFEDNVRPPGYDFTSSLREITADN